MGWGFSGQRASMDASSPSPAPAGGPRTSFVLVTNPESGSEKGPVIEEARRRLDVRRTLVIGREPDLGAAIRAAVEGGCVVVAAGGDGTVNAVVQHLVPDGTLGVLPLGTLNHFARDLGVDEQETAMPVLEAGAPQTIDVGRAGNRLFVNNVGLGLYPELVREREAREGRWGRLLAHLAAAIRVLRRARPVLGSIAVDGDHRDLAAWVVMVGNNRFRSDPGELGSRDRLDEGVLDVWMMRLGGRLERSTGPAWRVLRGTLAGSRRLIRTQGSVVEIQLRGNSRRISRDGEASERATSLRVEILPGGLNVLAP